MYCLTNIMKCGTSEHVLKTIKKGYLELFVEISEVSDGDILLIMLEGVENALAKGSEMDKDSHKNPIFQLISKGSIPNWLVLLQNHQNLKIYEKSYKILEEYFNCEVNDSSN